MNYRLGMFGCTFLLSILIHQLICMQSPSVPNPPPPTRAILACSTSALPLNGYTLIFSNSEATLRRCIIPLNYLLALFGPHDYNKLTCDFWLALQITIFGESAGSVSVGAQMSFKGGKTGSIFRGAIMQSGTPSTYVLPYQRTV